MNNTLIEAIEKRRTQYALGRNITQAQEEITALIEEAIKLSPSAFNSQSSRAVILFGQQSEKFWHIVMNELRIIVPADKFAPTEAKINSFAAGVGTILFYEDQQIITSLQQQYPNYAEQFPVWSEQGSGIAQFAVWSALANTGIGASLQHYNPLPDAAAAKEWQIPESWKLRAMMPFGSNEAPFPEKSFIDDTERFKVFY
ncbi:nitroreductase family protein [Snodgrassella alvi]|uniref:nitroreductase family protein n=1 Tax=Snodgrassella alvi TaxID=1196083 RepID=UPI000A00F299|nr:nitroreductase family protein [Snodgrassella alvi]ORF02580.1 nitroreductase family protein [Snodgrassella alvi]ORF10029.1 nitroreductase family protein [Snodgrassella alvi]ORF13814.1 nitroreductase family protein [Snodgrassella alvi]ORF14519.1 nitroreductase family protein [Snodgrassella alvi]ORF20894.1 nitroreductase family protein [Snodgrassella alvi]